MLARSVFIRTFSADFRIFLRYVFFHFRPFSPFLSRFCARTISGNQPLTSPSYYPVIPGAHTFLLSLSLSHTHKHTSDKEPEAESGVFSCKSLSSFLSLWILRGEEGGGVWRRRSGFVTVVPGDSEGSAGSNLGSDPLSSPWRPPH